ncbi:hypothetical protein PYCCODRAFT_1472200, partial [Trametes coccinea BRFM310]
MRNSVKSDKHGKPPGVSSYNIDIGSSLGPSAEDLRTIAASAETTAGIDLCAIQYGSGDVEIDSEWELADLAPPEPVDFDDAMSQADIDHLDVPIRVELPLTVAEGRERTSLGDLYAARAEEVLNRCAPYCCAEVDFDGGDEYDANV